INELPEYQSNIEEKIDSLHLSKNSTLRNASATVNEINKALVSPPDTPSDPESGRRLGKSRGTSANPVPVQVVTRPALPIQTVQSALGFTLQVLIVIVFTSFMLVQRENLRNRFIALVDQRQLSVMTHAIDEASERVSRYLRTQLTINAIYGTAIGIGLYFIGIPGALLWGVIVGILRFLPYVGPPLGGIMPVVLSLAIFHGWKIPLLTFAMFVVAEVIASHAIEPMLYGAHTGISSLAILVAAIFWTVLWGPVGLVLSTPLTVCIVVLGRYVPHLAFIPLLLGGDPVLAEEVLVYQRLLAMDQEEAEQVLESALEKRSLAEVYDSVLIPVLNMAEHDRHRGQIDDVMAGLIFQSTREIIDDLFVRCNESNGMGCISRGEIRDCQALNFKSEQEITILCVGARDEADDLVAIMLTQLLEQAGQSAACVPRGSADELIEQVKLHRAEIVCISGLPPFVISHSRTLCRALTLYSPTLPIVVGMWSFGGDMAKLAKRIGACGGSATVTTLADAIREVGHLHGAQLDPRADTSCV
ncbi:MAG: AI-2E family transporter, partial [Terracidiphilus sp.]